MPEPAVDPPFNSPVIRYDADRRALIVGDRPLPVSTAIIDNGHATYAFRIRRVIITFENQWQLSILWGDATYSDNHDWLEPLPGWPEPQPFVEEPLMVEVGVLHPTAELVGDPLGYVTPNHLLALASFVSKLPSDDPVRATAWRRIDHDGTVPGFIEAITNAE